MLRLSAAIFVFLLVCSSLTYQSGLYLQEKSSYKNMSSHLYSKLFLEKRLDFVASHTSFHNKLQQEEVINYAADDAEPPGENLKSDAHLADSRETVNDRFDKPVAGKQWPDTSIDTGVAPRAKPRERLSSKRKRDIAEALKSTGNHKPFRRADKSVEKQDGGQLILLHFSEFQQRREIHKQLMAKLEKNGSIDISDEQVMENLEQRGSVDIPEAVNAIKIFSASHLEYGPLQGTRLYATDLAARGFSCKQRCGEGGNRYTACDCDIHCPVMKSCCADFYSSCPNIYAESVQTFGQDLVDAKVICNSLTGSPVITTFRNGTEYTIPTSVPDIQSLTKITPVSDPKTKFAFATKDIFDSYVENRSLPSYWDVRLFVPSLPTTMQKLLDDMDRVVDLSTVAFENPERLPLACLRDGVATCPTTFPDGDVMSKCQDLDNYIMGALVSIDTRRYFRNPFCFLCNYRKRDFEQSDLIFIADRYPIPMSTDRRLSITFSMEDSGEETRILLATRHSASVWKEASCTLNVAGNSCNLSKCASGMSQDDDCLFHKTLSLHVGTTMGIPYASFAQDFTSYLRGKLDIDRGKELYREVLADSLKLFVFECSLRNATFQLSIEFRTSLETATDEEKQNVAKIAVDFLTRHICSSKNESQNVETHTSNTSKQCCDTFKTSKQCCDTSKTSKQCCDAEPNGKTEPLCDNINKRNQTIVDCPCVQTPTHRDMNGEPEMKVNLCFSEQREQQPKHCHDSDDTFITSKTVRPDCPGEQIESRNGGKCQGDTPFSSLQGWILVHVLILMLNNQ